jgi:hypothetical protein
MKRLWLLFWMVAVGALCILPVSAASYSLYCPYGTTVNSTQGYTTTYNGDFKAGQKWYFDLSVSAPTTIFYNTSGQQVSANASHVYHNYCISTDGASYDGADIALEGNNRIWVYFQQDMASVTLHYAVDYTLMWSPAAAGGTGTYPGYVVRRDFNASAGTMHFSSTGPSLASFNSKLDTIIDNLNTLFDRFKGFNTDDALYCFDSFHYDGTTSDTYPGMIASSGNLVIFSNTDSRYLNTFIPAGRYALLVNIDSSHSLPSSGWGFMFESNAPTPTVNDSLGVAATDFKYLGKFGNAKRYKAVIDVPAGGLTFGDAWISLDSSGGYGCAYLYLIEDNSLSSGINPNQSGKTDELNNAGNQQSSQENQLWQNINTYKSDISFSLDGWDDAASGLSYVTNIFMLIWNNSPTQPIVLSLMLGIAMLSIGRGVSAAVRVSHRRNKDD